MKAAVAVFLFYFLVAFLHGTRAGGGWHWDMANALGLAAYCGLLILMFGVRGANGRKFHEVIAYAVLTLTFAHGYWLILSDAALPVYFRPGAPLYMWAGVVALLALIYLVIFSRRADRQLIHKDFESFQRWHHYVSYVALAAGGYHILASGLYFSIPLQVIAAIAGVTAIIVFKDKLPDEVARPPGLVLYTALVVASAVVFVLARNVF